MIPEVNQYSHSCPNLSGGRGSGSAITEALGIICDERLMQGNSRKIDKARVVRFPSHEQSEDKEAVAEILSMNLTATITPHKIESDSSDSERCHTTVIHSESPYEKHNSFTPSSQPLYRYESEGSVDVESGSSPVIHSIPHESFTTSRLYQFSIIICCLMGSIFIVGGVALKYRSMG